MIVTESQVSTCTRINYIKAIQENLFIYFNSSLFYVK